MSKQNISIGSAPNDGTGDTLRGAATKINSNFTEIYDLLGFSGTLSEQVSLSYDAVVFEGTTPDDFEIRLKVTNPTADQIITLPNATGAVVLDTASQTLTNKTISLNETILNNTDISGAGNITSSSNTYIRFTGTTYTVTLDDGTSIGELKVFTNGASGNIITTVTNGVNFTLATNQSKMCIWNGAAWIQLT